MKLDVVEAEESKGKDKKSLLEAIQKKLEVFRSIALSILFIIGAIAVAAVVIHELSTDAMLVEVGQLPKAVSEQGASPETIELEIVSRIKGFQVSAHSQKPFTLDLAYILQSENKLRVLPELPASTQRLLIQHTRPIPDLVTSRLDSTIREALSYAAYLLKRETNRLSVSITAPGEGELFARVHIVRDDLDVTTSITATSANNLLEKVSFWVANQLLPQEMVLFQFQLDRATTDPSFDATTARIEELSSLNSQGGNKPFYLTILGDIAFQKSSYAEAEAYYRAALGSRPMFKDLVTYRLSQVLLAQGRNFQAVESLGVNAKNGSSAESVDHLARLSSIYLQVQSELGKHEISDVCLSQGKCVDEKSMYQLLESASAVSAVAANALGALKYVDGDVEDAQALFGRAMELDPSYSSALNNMGVIKMQEGKSADALVLFQNAASSNPDSGVAQLNLGNSLERFGRFSEAADHFSRAVRLNRDNLVCHTCWALSLINAGRIDQAVAAIQSGRRQDPQNVSLFLLSGQISSRLGCFQDAVDALEAAAHDSDGRVNRSMVHRDMGRAFLRLGDPDRARSEFSMQAQLLRFRSGGTNELERIIAGVYTRGHARTSGIVDLFEEAADEARKESDVTAEDISGEYVDLADAFLWRKEPVSAVNLARKAIELDSRQWNAHFALGRGYSALGRESLARAEFRMAHTLGGHDDVALLQAWSQSLERSGLPGKAEELKTEFKLHPRTCQK
ncbi:tetratricopeptide repeat protein [Solimonas sp. K1W22B-7]|uniref:tetratricopeptide repeat protein n=1 Tax=Solimonas sp. K1W22B-7 TaxID=2303331 RepID=UPI0013C43311|nr:tetratricopeptide repeat protein [Solimonas sp. K1W22B-7]